MKKILAMTAAAALAAGTSAWAANPFSDVSASDWAYQAVSDLSDQGIVEGYPDGTFKGQTSITRYEMAQIVARLMAKEDQYNAEQRATIDKLAGEYADELDTLGVRVANLEKKVGNISWGGDARMRYQSNDNGADEAWNGRIHIMMQGRVNEDTTVNARFSTDNVQFKGSDDADVGMESMNVQHDFGAAKITLGRYDLAVGNQGGWSYGNGWGFDGAEAAFRIGDKVTVKTGYGQFNFCAYDDDQSGDRSWKSKDLYYAQAEGNIGIGTLGLGYYSWQNSVTSGGAAGTAYKPELVDVQLTIPVGDFRVFGEYMKNTTAPDSYDTAWNAGIGYGAMDYTKPGTWNLDLSYNDVDDGTYIGGTTYETDILETLTNYTGNTINEQRNISYWLLMGNVAIAENVFIHGEYAFAADGTTEDPNDTWTLSLNYRY